ncbi:U3 small nucleolar RNA-interacting protein 2 isoform X4 [Lingula anatina]|uniref:U3 small nucleolar RNA-interacting protein 2 n=1 Tax=Lingula anatina TaxID=7574 RepID=A0A1S3JCF6_LINAN|nr:U3 small nucleolar RNA-interacting protein 2 isoform X3 [Lingula anatina]XP_013408090.1 U3 small nucleolar RNA-interacting protein 2 isoform X4 [Lingula anatina]|eukprot:XP_013408089.1 U3 small nucleolar RNA-interacting protein 2 isoform X3 [Lingula anatina]
MSFFIRSGRGRGGTAKGSKRKIDKSSKPQKNGTTIPNKKKIKTKFQSGGDEEIPSDSDEINSEEETYTKGKSHQYSTDEEEEEETAQEKKLRLTKQYLAQLEAEEAEKTDDEEGHDLVGERLKTDILEQAGKLQRKLADEYVQPSPDDITLLRGHQLAVTCLVITPDEKHVFSGSKDCSIVKWSLESKKKVHTIHGGRKGTEDRHVGHTSHVLCLAVSSDGTFLVSGDRNKLIHVWNPDTCQLLHTFTGHRDAVSGLAFRRGTHQLFSASHDRSVKIWNLDEMAYVETLFGHQDSISGIDSGTRDRAVTSGGRDGTVRIWKVVEESQLVFHGHGGCIDCVALINEEHFVSGSDNNSLSLWYVQKKKPICTVQNAHPGSEDGDPTVKNENWITSVAAIPNSDLIASGSKDGCLRLWKAEQGFRELTVHHVIPVRGFINCVQFSSQGNYLVAAVGQEHKLGRWWRLKDAKNGVCIIRLRKKNAT